MPVNLSRVNISISEFQKISSGKYNAGEVKLSGETTLAKMNNHVHKLEKNVETVPHEETLTIKDAFVRALASSGVGDAALNEVRRELGLAPDGTADKALLDRSVKPLSRQQIREILDRNAAAINAAKGAGTIRTDAQIHWSPFAASHAAKRDATNATLEQSRKPFAEKDIAHAQTLIGGDVDSRYGAERESLLQLAKLQKNFILMASAGNPSTAPDGQIPVTFQSDGTTYTATLNLGMSQADYVDKLDDIILRLTYGEELSGEDIAAREEFKALPDAARSDWASQLTRSSAEDGRKARAVAVMLMQEHGINDFETLSLVNRISDGAAVALVSSLVHVNRSVTGDAFRQSPDMQALSSAAAAHPVDLADDAKTSIPGVPARVYNEVICTDLAIDLDDLPAAYAKMALEVRAEVARRLGAEALPTPGLISSNTLFGLVGSAELDGLIPHDDDGVTRVTPESLRDGFKKAALERAAGKLVEKRVYAYASDNGITLTDAGVVIKDLMSRKPDLIESLAACQSPDEADDILDDLVADTQFQTAVARESALYECSWSIEDMGREALAAELDLEVGDLRAEGDVNSGILADLAAEMRIKIHSGEVKASTPAEVRKIFQDMAASYARSRAEALVGINALQVSPELRAGLRSVVLKMRSTDGLDLGAVAAAARQIDFSKVVSLIAANANPAEVYAAMADVDKDAAALSSQLIAAANGDSQDDARVTQLIYQFAIDRTPSGAKALEAFLARPDLPPVHVGADGQMLDVSMILHDIVSARNGSILVRKMEIRPIERSFLDGVGAVRAFEAGYLQSELPMLARTYAMCVAAGMSGEDALAAVLDPESKPRRLVRYGGRFTATIENFAQGLKLQEKFGEWFAGICAPAASRGGSPASDYFSSLTKTPEMADTLERFIFEEIAVNGNIPLDAANPEDIFGMKSNPATGFIGRITLHSIVHAVSHVSPAQRGLIYEVYNAFNPLEDGASALHAFHYHDMLVTHALSNYEALAALRDAGGLNRESAIKVLFPEVAGLPTGTNEELIAALNRAWNIGDQVELGARRSSYGSQQEYVDAKIAKDHAYRRLLSSGVSPSSVIAAVNSGMAMNPTVSFSSANYFDDAGMRAAGHPAQCERAAMKDLVISPTEPTWRKDWTKVVPAENGSHFVFKFPDGTEVATRRKAATLGELEQVADTVADKLAQMCGKVHQDQLAAVYRALSSDGGVPLVNFFMAQGISTDARCPLVQTIMKDEATGTITILHNNPEGFPYTFSWMTSVAVDGTTTNSPIFAMPVAAPAASVPPPVA